VPDTGQVLPEDKLPRNRKNRMLSVARFLRRAGIDRAVGFTVLGRGWNALAGLVTLLLMTRFLSPNQQGYYVTFGSVLGLSVFFEMGLFMVLVQFASHEKSRLEWTPAGTLEGDPAAKARLASLLRLSLKWYGIAALLLFATLLPVGLFFFSQHPYPGIYWQIPWVWIVLVTALTVALTPVLTLLEGCGLIAEIARLLVWQNVLGSVLLWIVLIGHGGVYTVPVTNTVVLVCQIVWVVSRKRHFLADLLGYDGHAARIDWHREIWPMQWKIGLSSISGYLIFQLFNPVLFATQGARVAGQMGLSLSVIGTVASIALSWVATKAWTFGAQIARREYAELDRLFFPAFWRSLGLVIFACGSVWGVGWYLHAAHFPIGTRILPPLPLGLLAAAAVVNHVTFAEAIYLRAHKQEPFLALSLITAFFIALATLLLSVPFGVTGIMVCYFVICIGSLIGATSIFVRKRREWHTIL